ncbi:MAG: SDR family oxidoreductase [Alphaproteobacteria bacterium]|nr:SDR family oxidoreductase [Alphaproteobacteria bacterium]
MDLGIAGRTAIVCAASKGLGKATAMSLAKNGVNLVINARTKDALEAAAAEMRKTGVAVAAVAADVTTDAGREALLWACPNPDILINNAGGPPPGDFRDWGREHWLAAVEANMLTPILLTKAVIDGMVARKFGRVVNITSGAVKAPIDVLGLSNGARSGLTGFIAGLARNPAIAAANVTVNNVLPGAFDTDRFRGVIANQAKKTGKSPDALFAERMKTVPAGRPGLPDEFGELCAFVCSAQAGYLTGQNLLIDGGAYPGTF